MSIREAWEHEQPQLMPMPAAFDGYVEIPVRVSSTSLIRVSRNRYSVPCALAGHRVSVRLYPERVVIVADQRVVAEHPRAFQLLQTLDVVGLQCAKPLALGIDRLLAELVLPGDLHDRTDVRFA